MRKLTALLALLFAIALGGVASAGPATAVGNCSIASACKHLFHLNQGNNAIDVTLHYDIKNAEDSGWKDIGCAVVDIKTNPANSLDAVRVYVEVTPGVFTVINPAPACYLGGTVATWNDVASSGSYTYSGSRPYRSFRNDSAPRLRATVWGLDGQGSASVANYWVMS